MGEAQYVWVLIKNNTFDMPMQYVSSIFNLEDKTRVELLEISYDFERAQDRTHNSDTFSCSESSTSGNLKRHERTYSGDKPFSCSQCDNKYSISSHLKRHERTHTVVKPFSCSQCDKNGQPQANLIDTKEPRAVINHSVAPCVTTNVYYQTIDIKETTLVILTWWKKFQE